MNKKVRKRAKIHRLYPFREREREREGERKKASEKESPEMAMVMSVVNSSQSATFLALPFLCSIKEG